MFAHTGVLLYVSVAVSTVDAVYAGTVGPNAGGRAQDQKKYPGTYPTLCTREATIHWTAQYKSKK